MKGVLFCQPKDKAKDLDGYLRDKQARFYADGNAALPSGPLIVTAPLPIAPADSHPAFPEIVRQKIEAGQACILKDIRTRFSLAENEQIESDFFTFLAEPFERYAKNTVVLTRKTNLGTFFILFPDITVNLIRDDATQQEFLSIVDDGRPSYPVPPPKPIELHILANAALGAKSYTITSLKVTSSTKIEFGWSVPDDPYANKEWWGVFQGVMPSWNYLQKYNNWDWICPKGLNYGSNGSRTVSVDTMTSGAIYTFALFIWKWDVGDYQQFTAP